eukprot:symbB.v1.2.024482.t1/scaffold2323.1/size82334/2
MEPLVTAAWQRWPTLKCLEGAGFSRSFSSKGYKIKRVRYPWKTELQKMILGCLTFSGIQLESLSCDL